jgi:hypothetical protein
MATGSRVADAAACPAAGGEWSGGGASGGCWNVVVVGDRVPDSFAPVQRQRATLSVVVWWWGQVKLKGSVTRVVISGAESNPVRANPRVVYR